MDTFNVSVAVSIDADADAVYRYVSDLERAGEWSPECTGGRWLTGVPGEVGSVFEGRNHRPADVVPWAPVVRGTWTTASEVVEAAPPRAFRWAMRNRAGRAQDSVWSFVLEAQTPGTRLTHEFRMGERTEGLGEILSGLSHDDQSRFLVAWDDKLRADMTSTVERIRSVFETAEAGAFASPRRD